MKRFIGSLAVGAVLLGAGLAWGMAPAKKITFDYYISKLAFDKNLLVAGLEDGKVVIEKWNGEGNLSKPIAVIQLPKIHDFMGDLQPMPIYSLDLSPDGKRLLILGEGDDAKREVFIYDLENRKLQKVWETPITLMRGIFAPDGKLFFALLSDEALLFDPSSQKVVYRKQVGNYVFSTWAISRDRSIAVFGDESGAAKMVDISTGKVVMVINGYNKDKTIGLDLNQRYVVNGSADQRISVYDYRQERFVKKFKSNFLPYGVAISPNSKWLAYQLDEQNDIELESLDGEQREILKGHTMALNGLKFENNTTLISYSPAEVLIWKVGEEKGNEVKGKGEQSNSTPTDNKEGK